MAKRLGAKHKKQARDLATALKKGEKVAKPHKVAVKRSRKAKLKKANPMK